MKTRYKILLGLGLLFLVYATVVNSALLFYELRQSSPVNAFVPQKGEIQGERIVFFSGQEIDGYKISVRKSLRLGSEEVALSVVLIRISDGIETPAVFAGEVLELPDGSYKIVEITVLSDVGKVVVKKIIPSIPHAQRA